MEVPTPKTWKLAREILDGKKSISDPEVQTALRENQEPLNLLDVAAREILSLLRQRAGILVDTSGYVDDWNLKKFVGEAQKIDKIEVSSPLWDVTFEYLWKKAVLCGGIFFLGVAAGYAWRMAQGW